MNVENKEYSDEEVKNEEKYIEEVSSDGKSAVKVKDTKCLSKEYIAGKSFNKTGSPEDPYKTTTAQNNKPSFNKEPRSNQDKGDSNEILSEGALKEEYIQRTDSNEVVPSANYDTNRGEFSQEKSADTSSEDEPGCHEHLTATEKENIKLDNEQLAKDEINEAADSNELVSWTTVATFGVGGRLDETRPYDSSVGGASRREEMYSDEAVPESPLDANVVTEVSYLYIKTGSEDKVEENEQSGNFQS